MVMAFGLFAGLCPSCGGDSNPVIEQPPWTCDGTVSDESARPLADVQVWVSGHQQNTTDSTGAYHAILGMSRDAVEAIRFARAGFRDTLVSLAAAVEVGDHRLAMDVQMRREDGQATESK